MPKKLQATLNRHTFKFYQHLDWCSGALFKGWVESAPLTFSESITLETFILTTIPTKLTPSFLRYIAQIEVENVTDKNTLFRTDSILTKLFRIFSVEVCGATIKKALHDTVNQIAQQTEKLSKMTGTRYQKKLKVESFMIFDIICNTVLQLDEIYQKAMTAIKDEVTAKFPGTESSLIASFYFLRFVCPILVNAGTNFGIDFSVYPNAQRHLITISKIIQSLANKELPPDETIRPVVIDLLAKDNYQTNWDHVVISLLNDTGSSGARSSLTQTNQIDRFATSQCISVSPILRITSQSPSRLASSSMPHLSFKSLSSSPLQQMIETMGDLSSDDDRDDVIPIQSFSIPF